MLDGGGFDVERGALAAGYVYLDGLGIGDVEQVLRDRRHLADDGVLVVTVGFDVATGEIVFGPDIGSRGVTDEPKDLHEEVARSVAVALDDLELPADLDTVRREIRSAAGRAVKRELNRRPVVFPVLIEV